MPTPKTTIKKLAITAATHLRTVAGTEALDEAQLLLAWVIKKSREFLFTYPETILPPATMRRYAHVVAQRAAGIPLAYITHEKYFYGLPFYVNRSVLIPRPESELLIEILAQVLSPKTKAVIADIGTGSGAIAITIKTLFPTATVYASDISRQALVVAKKNAQANKVSLRWKHGNGYAPFKRMKVTGVVANLPYVPTPQFKKIGTHPHTLGLQFEPRTALDGGGDGFTLIHQLLTDIAATKNKPSWIVLEHHESHPPLIRVLAQQLFPRARVTTFKDTCGLDRATLITLK